MVRQLIKKYVSKLPYYKKLLKEIYIYKTTFPSGHYYSPIISKAEIQQRENESSLSKRIRL